MSKQPGRCWRMFFCGIRQDVHALHDSFPPCVVFYCVCVRQAEESSETACQKNNKKKQQNLKNQRSAVTRCHEDLASCPAFENP